MTTKNFNAKKMLMSTLAAVAFSFVFTTSAGASTIGEASQYEASKCEVQKASNDNNQEKQKVETFWDLVKRYVWPLR